MNIAQQISALQCSVGTASAEAARYQPRPRGCGNTRTQELLDYISQHGMVTTKTLCGAFGISSRQVWGMLKAPRNAGKVTCFDGLWELSSAHDDRKVHEAVALLEGLGWSCFPPDDYHA